MSGLLPAIGRTAGDGREGGPCRFRGRSHLDARVLFELGELGLRRRGYVLSWRCHGSRCAKAGDKARAGVVGVGDYGEYKYN